MTKELDEVLQHYGVKGMKWGVRKEDKAARRQSKRDEKVSKLTSKAESYRKQISSATNQEASNRFQQYRTNSKVKRLEKKELQAIKDAAAKREGKLTRKEKQLAVGAAIVGAVAVYAVGSNVQSGEARALINKGKSLLKGEEFQFKKKSEFQDIINNEQDLFEVASRINKTNSIGGKVNCKRCTYAYELQRRGFDVEATKTTTSRGQTTIGDFNAMNPNDKNINTKFGFLSRTMTDMMSREKGGKAEFVDYLEGLSKDTYKTDSTGDVGSKLLKDLSKMPDKARGEVVMQWKGGGGHSVAWEVINGRPVIIDAQVKKMFKNASEFDEYAQHIDTATFKRLDNVDLDLNFLQRWAKNAK